jgi:hypothetical protein
MKNTTLSNGYWQGWNEFLGIEKEIDIKNYLINLIGDIMDDFMFNDRKEELAKILVFDNTNSFLIHSVDAYRSINPDKISWMQVRIYFVDKYFIILSLNWDGASQCHYVGTNTNIAIRSFYDTVTTSQSLIHMFICFNPPPELDLSEENVSDFDLSGYYKLAGFNVSKFDQKDCKNLRHTISEFRKIRRKLSNLK